MKCKFFNALFTIALVLVFSLTTALPALASAKVTSAVTIGTIQADPQPEDHITITPSDLSITVGGTQTYTAQRFDTGNNPVTDNYTWSCTNPVAGTIDPSTGLFTAGTATGNYPDVITATSNFDGKTGTTSVTMVAGALDYIEVNPSNPSVVIGETQTYTALGYDASNNLVPATFTWSCTNPVAGTIDPSTGLFTAGTTPHKYNNVIHAESGDKIGTASVTVVPGALDYIAVSPSNRSIAMGGTQTYTAQRYDILGHPIADTYTWSCTNPDAGTIDTSSGLFTAGTIPGNYSDVITATSDSDNKTGIASVTIAANDASLSNLTISAGTLIPAFASSTLIYTDSVDNGVNSVTITPIVNEINATVTVNSQPVASGSPSPSISLNVGSNTVSIVVTAQDASTQTYTITVTRAPALSSDARLSNLTISTGTLTPAFNFDTFSYTNKVSNSVSSVTVSPTLSDKNATVNVNSQPVVSGSTSQSISLSVGSNTITIEVTGHDGNTKNTYTININRAASRSGGGGGGGGSGIVSTPKTISGIGSISVGSIVGTTGVFTQSATLQSPDKNTTLNIPINTTGKTMDGSPLSTITVTSLVTQPAPSTGSYIVGVSYEFGPNGATFNPQIIMTLHYDPTSIPVGVPETNLVAAFYDTASNQWEALDDFIIDQAAHIITVPVTHFTLFAVMAQKSKSTPTSTPIPTPPLQSETVSPIIPPSPTPDSLSSPKPIVAVIPTLTTTRSATPAELPTIYRALIVGILFVFAIVIILVLFIRRKGI